MQTSFTKRCTFLILALSFGLMSFALPGSHFTYKSIYGIDHLSLEPDATALSGYGSDGFLLGHLLDMLAGIEDHTADGPEQPAKHFNFHYSYFNLHKLNQERFIDKRLNKKCLFIPAFCLVLLNQAGFADKQAPSLPSYYSFLFRLTPF